MLFRTNAGKDWQVVEIIAAKLRVGKNEHTIILKI
jgi:hypothetical protein